MRSCKKCNSNISLFISVAAVILALLAYFHKIKRTESFSENPKWTIKRGEHELLHMYNGQEVMNISKNGNLTIRGALIVDKDIIVGADIIKNKKPYFLKVKDADKFVKKRK
jgi:hypothetical protein